MIPENKKYKTLKDYTKKINNYLLLINNEELNKDEKELLKKKINKTIEKLEFIKKAEKLNIEEIKKKEKLIKEERLLNQFKAYLTNKNIYLEFKKNNNFPSDFKDVYECFDVVDKEYQLKKEDKIEEKKINDIKEDFYFFIKIFNKKNHINSLFNIFNND